jgi:hypothetical protein
MADPKQASFDILFCKQSKIELWYQILAFCEIAGMIYLGACPAGL